MFLTDQVRQYRLPPPAGRGGVSVETALKLVGHFRENLPAKLRIRVGHPVVEGCRIDGRTDVVLYWLMPGTHAPVFLACGALNPETLAGAVESLRDLL